MDTVIGVGIGRTNNDNCILFLYLRHHIQTVDNIDYNSLSYILYD